MGQILVDDLPGDVIERLKRKAIAEGQTFEDYVRLLLEQASGFDRQEFLAIADEVAELTRGRNQSDAAELIREYRSTARTERRPKPFVEREAARGLARLGGSDPGIDDVPRRRSALKLAFRRKQLPLPATRP